MAESSRGNIWVGSQMFSTAEDLATVSYTIILVLSFVSYNKVSPVATYVRLVADSSQGDAVKLSAQRAGDGSANAGLSHAWGSHETQNGPLKGTLELPDSQIL